MFRLAAAIAFVLAAVCVWAVGRGASAKPPVSGPAGKLPARNRAGRLVNPEVWMCHGKPFALLDPDKKWDFVRKHITGIKIYTGGIRKARGPRLAKLGELAKMLKAEGIQMAIECGGTLGGLPLDDTNGVRSAEHELKVVGKYTAAGGRVDFLDMDHPVRRLLSPGNNREGFKSIDRCADQLVKYMTAVRKGAPQMKFFLLTNFPNWGYRGDVSYHARGPARQDWGEYDDVARTVVAKAKAAKLPLVGITVDNPYGYLMGEHKSATLADPKKVDWLKRVRALEDWARSEALQFNLIVNCERGGNTSAKLFYEETLKMVDAYVAAGGKPTRYIVQSWYPNPRKVVPDDEPYTMTALAKAVMLKVHPELRSQAPATQPQAER